MTGHTRREILTGIAAAAAARAQRAVENPPMQHKVSNPESPAPEPGAENQPIPSLVMGLRGADDWHKVRRPELLRLWTSILGKLEPNEADTRWFGDIRQSVIHGKTDLDTYTRIDLELPIEKDFLQNHLL